MVSVNVKRHVYFMELWGRIERKRPYNRGDVHFFISSSLLPYEYTCGMRHGVESIHTDIHDKERESGGGGGGG